MARKHHTRRSMKRHAKKTHRVRKMRGGQAPVGEPYATGNLVLPQGMAFRGMTHTGGDSPFYGVKPVVPMQQGGEAPYPGSGRFDGGLAQAAGTASIDRALQEVAGLRDPNQMGGRKRKSTKKSRKTHRKSKKSHRKSRKTHRKSKKSHRKSKKSHRKSKKSHRKSKKSHRKGRKSQRGGVMDYKDSMSGGIIGSDLLEKAGLHPSWKSVEAGNMF
jgi:hypothetical protein